MAFSESGSKHILTSPLDNNQSVFKLIILGDKGVGKTTLVRTFIHRKECYEFVDDEDYASTTSNPSYGGSSYDDSFTSFPTFKFSSTLKLGKREVKLNIWDTAGLVNMDSVFQTLCKYSIIASDDIRQRNGLLKKCVIFDSFITSSNTSNNYTSDSNENIEKGLRIGDGPLEQMTNDQLIHVSHQNKTLKLKTKIVLLGDAGVGKTTLFDKFEFSRKATSHVERLAYKHTETVALDQVTNYRVNQSRCLQRKGHYYVEQHTEYGHVNMMVCDTAGQERYRSLTASYYRGAHGCLLLFDVTKPHTFESLGTWHNDLTCYSVNPEMISIILVGTTCQTAERQIPKEKAQKYAEHLGIPYQEINLQDTHDVTRLFEDLSDLIIENYKRHRSILDEQTASFGNIAKVRTKRKSWCSC